MKQSLKYTLNKQDLLKIAKGAGIAVGGSLCAYLATIIPEMDFGPQTLVISTIAMIIINAGLKYFQGR
jgi:hypothetical protein